MPIWPEANAFPERGFPVLADPFDRICLGTLYTQPIPNGLVIDVVGNSRLFGTLQISGALSGCTTIGASSTVTLSNATAPLTLSGATAVLRMTGQNAVFSMTGLQGSIGTTLARIPKGFFKTLEITDKPTVSGDPVAVMGDVAPYIDQAVKVASSPTFADLTLTGNLLPEGNLNLGGYGVTTINPTGGDFDTIVQSDTDANWIFGDASTGNLGIGAGSGPTARLHLGAGTTAAGTAPLKFTSGSLNTAAEAGAVEFLTDTLYLAISTGPVRKELAINDQTLTATRVVFVSNTGRLTDDADMTFVSDTLSVAKVSLTGTLSFNSSLGNQTASGIIVTETAGENLAFGNIVYKYSDGKLRKAANSSTTTIPPYAMALATISSDNAGLFLKTGYVRNDSWSALTVGGFDGYVWLGTGGAHTQPKPTTAGVQQLPVGIAAASKIMWFAPDITNVRVVEEEP